MSGKKCANVRLTEAARREFDEAIEQANRAADAVAKLANLAGRVEALLADVEKFKVNEHTSREFRANLREFTVDVARFREQRQGLQQATAEMRLASANATRSALEQLQRQRDVIEPLMRGLAELQGRLVNRVPIIEGGLRAEARTEQYQQAARVQEQRRALAGLREEIVSQMDRRAFDSLEALQARADALLAQVETLQGGSCGATDVSACRAGLDGLVAEAKTAHRENLERFEIMCRIDDSCRPLGLDRVTDLRLVTLDHPLSAIYVQQEHSQQSSIEVQLRTKHSIDVSMYTPEGDSIAFQPKLHCYSDIQALADRLRDHQVVMHNCVQNDPDNPENWIAIDLPTDADPLEPKRRRKPMERALERKKR